MMACDNRSMLFKIFFLNSSVSVILAEITVYTVMINIHELC